MGGDRTGRRAAAVLLVGAAVLVGAGCSQSNYAGADCAWELHYAGRTYLELPGSASIKVEPHQGSPLGEGGFDGCQDGGGPESAQTVDVYRVPGVVPEQAVMTGDDVIGVIDPQHVPAPLAMPDE